MEHRGGRRNGAYFYFSPRSPYARDCPTCLAVRGERCWSMHATEVPKRIKSCHQARRATSKDADGPR